MPSQPELDSFQITQTKLIRIALSLLPTLMVAVLGITLGSAMDMAKMEKMPLILLSSDFHSWFLSILARQFKDKIKDNHLPMKNINSSFIRLSYSATKNSIILILM
jgi:hypothetical protein